jgi:hypothetical protein|tara:strand:- start:549 stop:815 length:267 start_codon:yes stop_codon:yes gene_type:complete
MSKSWRSGPRRYLNARPIYEKDFPKLIAAMQEDNLIAIITSAGILWYSGGYEVKPSSIRDVWGITQNQMARLNNYIYVNDPFTGDVDE